MFFVFQNILLLFCVCHQPKYIVKPPTWHYQKSFCFISKIYLLLMLHLSSLPESIPTFLSPLLWNFSLILLVSHYTQWLQRNKIFYFCIHLFTMFNKLWRAIHCQYNQIACFYFFITFLNRHQLSCIVRSLLRNHGVQSSFTLHSSLAKSFSTLALGSPKPCIWLW